MNYNITCEIETAQAVKAQALFQRSSALPLVPTEQSSFVLTLFWVDNFDIKVESLTGKNSINITHPVAYEEESEASKLRDNNFSVPKSSKTISQNFGDSSTKTVISKAEPDLFASEVRGFDDLDLVSIFAKYFYWLWIRKHNSFDIIN